MGSGLGSRLDSFCALSLACRLGTGMVGHRAACAYAACASKGIIRTICMHRTGQGHTVWREREALHAVLVLLQQRARRMGGV